MVGHLDFKPQIVSYALKIQYKPFKCMTFIRSLFVKLVAAPGADGRER